MERTVPTTESEEVELYTRTYYSLLRTTAEVQIRTLEEVHAGTKSLLHPGARDPAPDMSAFIYCLLRLPGCMINTDLVILGQSTEVFERAGFTDIGSWAECSAPARRRRCYFDGQGRMACLIASRSDIDDLIPLLTAYQIEWNKLHRLLQSLPGDVSIRELCASASGCAELASMTSISEEDFDRLYAIWDQDTAGYLEQIAMRPLSLRVQLLSGSLSEYRRATHAWWHNIEHSAPQITEKPVYFVSSNIHSLPNILTGFALRNAEELIRFLERSGNAGLLREWEDIQAGRANASAENFLYYVLKKYQQTADGHRLIQEQVDDECRLGILRIVSKRAFHVDAQVIQLASLDPRYVDPRLLQGDLNDLEEWLPESDALILNIDYPLGLAAYNILTEVSDHTAEILGVYVMGKAATLNGVIGDVMIPNVVHDEHSQNTFLFLNCFSAADVSPFLHSGTVLDNQKAVTVQGTFLQNYQYMDVFYREGYTDIEMEAGPYLSAVYEMYRPKRHPVNEIVNLYGIPFDLGFLHYSSDTPLSKGKNLGAGSLSYMGMDSTYAVSVAVLRRILTQERERLKRR